MRLTTDKEQDMRVHDTKNWTIEKVYIASTMTTGREQYFVDDKSGKNWIVCDSLQDAKNWIGENKWEEQMM